jgi:hypothetical protein
VAVDESQIVVGTKYRFRGHLWHVRAIFDGNYCAVRRWSKKRQAWVYEVEMIDVLAILINGGNATLA